MPVNGIPSTDIKSIKFFTYYLDEDIQFADDTEFWIKVGARLPMLSVMTNIYPLLLRQKKNPK